MDGSQPETGSQYNAWSLASSWRCQNSLRQSGSARLHKTISRLQLAFCMGLFSNYLEPFFCKSELKYQIFFKKKTEAARAVNIYRISSIARIKHSAHFAKTTCNTAVSTIASSMSKVKPSKHSTIKLVVLKQTQTKLAVPLQAKHLTFEMHQPLSTCRWSISGGIVRTQAMQYKDILYVQPPRVVCILPFSLAIYMPRRSGN